QANLRWTPSEARSPKIDARVFRLPNLPRRRCLDRSLAITGCVCAWQRAGLLRLGRARQISAARISKCRYRLRRREIAARDASVGSSPFSATGRNPTLWIEARFHAAGKSTPASLSRERGDAGT